MKIHFDYEENIAGHSLITKTAEGLSLQVYFGDGTEATHLYIADTYEMDIPSDDYKGLYVRIGSGIDAQVVPVSTVIEEAEKQIEGILKEIRAEEQAEERLTRSRYLD